MFVYLKCSKLFGLFQQVQFDNFYLNIRNQILLLLYLEEWKVLQYFANAR